MSAALPSLAVPASLVIVVVAVADFADVVCTEGADLGDDKNKKQVSETCGRNIFCKEKKKTTLKKNLRTFFSVGNKFSCTFSLNISDTST